jgi:hypothetical protein
MDDGGGDGADGDGGGDDGGGGGGGGGGVMIKDLQYVSNRPKRNMFENYVRAQRVETMLRIAKRPRVQRVNKCVWVIALVVVLMVMAVVMMVVVVVVVVVV